MGGGSGIAAKKDETVVAEAEDLIVLGDIYLCEGFLGAVEGYRREFLQVQVAEAAFMKPLAIGPSKATTISAVMAAPEVLLTMTVLFSPNFLLLNSANWTVLPDKPLIP